MNIETFLLELSNKKEQLDQFRPLPPELVKNLDDWFKIELTYHSNALEGNTLTKSETALVVEKGLTVAGKSVREHLEAINHAYAIDFIKGLVSKPRSELSLRDINDIHQLILKRIDDIHAGTFRKIAVRISGSDVVLADPLKIPELMDAFMSWLQTVEGNPVIIAADAHLKLVTIHPYIDGNGRTARLLMNLLLLQTGYPPAIIKKEDRLMYINALEKAQLTGDVTDFYEVILKAVLYSLEQYLHAIKKSGLKKRS